MKLGSVICALAVALVAPLSAQTINLEGAILQDTPIILTEPGATYVLMEDVTAPGTAFAFHGNADGATLDLNGHTVTFGTEPGELRHGVATAMHYYRADRYPDLPESIFVDSGAQAVTVRNGSVVQGGDGFNCNAIMIRGGGGHRITGLTLRVNGIDARGVWGEYSDGNEIDNNTIYNDSRWVENRHQGCGSIDFPNSGETPNTIHHNTIIGGPQYGIRLASNGTITPNGHAEIYANNIYLDAMVSNSYSIGIYYPGVRVYDNVIEPTNGRGIHLHDDGAEVFNNTLDIICLGNAEYAVMSSHGIKIEDGTNSDIWGNHVTSRGRHDSGDIFVHPLTGDQRQVRALGDCLNIDVQTNSNNYIHDNTFIAIHEGGDLVEATNHFTDRAAALAYYDVHPGHGTRLENNTFISNSVLIYSDWGYNGEPADLLVDSCTFERDSTPADGHQFVPSVWYQHIAEREVTALRNSTIGAGIDFRDVEEGSGVLDYTLAVEWILSVSVRTDEGSPVPGANVTVSGPGVADLVLTTDAAGVAPFPLREYAVVREGGSTDVAEYNPYSVLVSYAGAEATQTVSMTAPQTLEITLSGVTVDSPGQPGTVTLTPVNN